MLGRHNVVYIQKILIISVFCYGYIAHLVFYYCFIKNKFQKEDKIMACMKKMIGAC